MSGETDLAVLFSNLKVRKSDELYVFVSCAAEDMPENVPKNLRENLAVLMRFEEAEGTTLILTKSLAEQHNLPYEFECYCLTLDIHSSLEAVGFMARIASLLAAAQIPVNPVAGFYHDHLFIPAKKADEALSLLQALADNAS